MPRETLFISDLHLSASAPARTRLFVSFLQTRANKADRIFILGDLFDAYIGDDDTSSPNREVKAALSGLSQSGTRVFFLQGNRDFLIGAEFGRQTGVELLDDYAVIDLYGIRALVTHGDLLCTDDIQYQQARARIRTPEWQQNALSKPLLLRQCYARWYRFKSGLDKRGKTKEIMDVNADAVEQALRQYGTNVLIHGHTHRPGYHELEKDGQLSRRWVLPEWSETGYALVWQDTGAHRIESFDSPA
jgi:UDP-2,3-diacylglucosamine hydrolase